jgi:ribose 5-phosphate isomerase B
MNISLGSDHRGLELKRTIIKQLEAEGYVCHDVGAYTDKSADYPDFARAAAEEVAEGKSVFGILVCGTGIGMCIAANKVPGIRAAVCYSVFLAGRARLHNNANVLCLGAEIEAPVKEIVDTFLKTSFEGGRHQLRLDKVTDMEHVCRHA